MTMENRVKRLLSRNTETCPTLSTFPVLILGGLLKNASQIPVQSIEMSINFMQNQTSGERGR
jgi:hypothetical protein